MRVQPSPGGVDLPGDWDLGTPCPACGTQAAHVIYYGLPMWLCNNELCSTLFGFWAFISECLPFNGYFFAFEGGYWGALWVWLTHPSDNGPDGPDGFV